MADNNNVDAVAAAGGEEGVPRPPEITLVDTKIEEVASSRPNERKFSIQFDNFKELPSEKGHEVRSSTLFSCFGDEWRIDIYPGGYYEYSADGMVCVFLHRTSTGKNLKIQFSFEIGDITDSKDLNIRQGTHEFAGEDDSGFWNFIPRSELVDDFLQEGALTIYVTMQLAEFIPNNPASSIMLKLFGDEKTADVVFEVSENQKPEGKSKSRKRAKISSANFYAHRFILQHHSPELAALCAMSEGMTPILINDVKAEVFRHLLYYVYGGEINEDDFKSHAKDLINAADKYGVTNLKLAAEVWYVHNAEITFDNVIDNLLYADAMNCALLKETVMDFIVKNKKEVMQRVSFQDVPGNMYKDLLAAVSRRENERKDDSDSDDDDEDENEDSDDLATMRIGELRQKVQEKGLEIDGSRDALIAALKEHS